MNGITGHDLIAAGFEAGPELGKALAYGPCVTFDTRNGKQTFATGGTKLEAKHQSGQTEF